ncbi:hypothetical protein EDD21DRAFT_385687 [Dissophora ornata]|nr:hypothetical protein EDD21DRAFT_385687 [Dissophora ornata]
MQPTHTQHLPPSTDVVVVGNGPAGILLSLLLSGYEPYYHADPSRPHPDPILHRMLTRSSLTGCRPRSLLNQDFVQLTNHIQHQLAEAGRDANPISAMFDSLAHPLLDTHRGEYPSFLEWKRPSVCKTNRDVDSPQPTSSLPSSSVSSGDEKSTSTARPHVVLGRGEAGGIWADMDLDHNQTLSYQEHMELPLYSFSEFVREHPEHGDENLERPLRSTVSAYYKEYVKHIGIQSNLSNYTTVTGIYHLKDLENHCCCPLDHQLRNRNKRQGSLHSPAPQESDKARFVDTCRTCALFRYAVVGYVESAPDRNNHHLLSTKKRTKFLIRSKTVILATGTFDQPKKLPAVSAHPCSPPVNPGATIQQTFHDTRQLEEWMMRHGTPTPRVMSTTYTSEVSPPPSPSSSSPSSSPSPPSLAPNVSTPSTTLPIVIVGTGLSAADAILLIQEKQPWRRIIHIYKHFSSSEPSPLKRCHRDVYPEYASVWARMKKFATLKNSVQSYPSSRKDGSASGNSGYCSVFGGAEEKLKNACGRCEEKEKEMMALSEYDAAMGVSPLCSGCAYKGLPDASVSSWNPVTKEIVIILSHGVVVRESVAAVGVFIGKQVHMGFLKGSLATEMISSSAPGDNFGADQVISRGRLTRKIRGHSSSDLLADIPTPPCTPPRSPVMRPRHQSFWQRQILQATGVQGLGLKTAPTASLTLTFSDEDIKKVRCSVDDSKDNADQGGNNEEFEEDEEDEEEEEEEEKEDDDEDEEKEEDKVDESQVLTLLHPLVSDMYNFRIIPTGVIADPMSPSSITTSICSPTPAALPAYPTKPKRCTRLPCYPIRRPNTTAATASTSNTVHDSSSSSASSTCGSDDSDDTKINSRVDCLLLISDNKLHGSTAGSESSIMKAMSMSCISMPCSPLLGCRIVCPDLASPPLLSLYSAAASAVASSITALMPFTSSSTSSPSFSEFSSTTVSASSSTFSLVGKLEDEDAKENTATSQGTKDLCILTPPASSSPCTSTAIATTDSEPIEHEEELEPLMDQSIYAAGAITGSKFVRYVLGNGVAIVADILKSEPLRT